MKISPAIARVDYRSRVYSASGWHSASGNRERTAVLRRNFFSRDRRFRMAAGYELFMIPRVNNCLRSEQSKSSVCHGPIS